MKMIKYSLLVSILFLSNSYSQSVLEFQKQYSGKCTWKADSGELKLETSGAINFKEKGTKGFLWDVPVEVKKIIISANTKVNGGFHTSGDCIIIGKDRKTSVVYGTETQSWPQKNNIKAFEIS
jgi:hypothetical protein